MRSRARKAALRIVESSDALPRDAERRVKRKHTKPQEEVIAHDVNGHVEDLHQAEELPSLDKFLISHDGDSSDQENESDGDEDDEEDSDAESDDDLSGVDGYDDDGGDSSGDTDAEVSDVEDEDSSVGSDSGSEVASEDEQDLSSDLDLEFKKGIRTKVSGSSSLTRSGIPSGKDAAGSPRSGEASGSDEKTVPQADEYEHDSSDEEDLRNTVGNIPMEWYKDFAHIGYDHDGRKIIKPAQGDELDYFLEKMENPDFWRTVQDKLTGQKVILSSEDVKLIKRIQKGKVGDAKYNPYEPWEEFFTRKVMQMPVTGAPIPKRSFIPSKTEREQVSRLVHAIKMGWLKPRAPKKKKGDPLNLYMLWNNQEDGESMRRIVDHIPAPKLKLPSHAESYNPPTEYLFNEKEKKIWNDLADEPWRRKYNFMPQKFDSLRKVTGYDRFVRERFERCMDLYLAPRARRSRLTIEPEDLMPKLPKPRELQPFPTQQSLVYEGHKDMVRTITVEPAGQFIASGSDDCTVKVWEIATGRCLKTFDVGAVVKSVAWCPSTTVSLLAVACDVYCYIINPGVGDKLITVETDNLLRTPPEQGDVLIPARVRSAIEWQVPTDEQWEKSGIRVIVKHFKSVRQVTWHGKGDYFATVMPDGLNRAVMIHQLSKRKSQQPFEKAKGLVQCALFHPIRPYLFVATKSYIRVYNLVKQELSKKLLTSMKWISSIAVHPGGDNVLVGTYDTRVQWFDLDLSTKPYKVLRHHRKAVRAVAYHKRYPLFASCSDEGTVTIFHGMVYSDLLQNPTIVPVKVLRGHTIYDDFSVLDCTFHPTQPWVFSSGADHTIRLFT